MRAALVAGVLAALGAHADVTIYTTFATATDGSIVAPTGIPAAVAAMAAYNTTTLIPPPLPNPLPSLDMTATVFADASTVANLSAPVNGNFIGFSVELSVANQIVGTNSSRLAVPFLNYISNLKTRAGTSPNIRIGGNTQENYILYPDGFPDYQLINKTEAVGAITKTQTPVVDIAADLLYAMMNITALLGTDWYFGLPFADINNNTGIATDVAFVEDVLGDHLLALQLGNEPDLYGVDNRKRIGPYPINEYMGEIQSVISTMQANSAIKNQQILLGPSICCNVQPTVAPWGINDVLGSEYLNTMGNSLKMLAVQHYPHDNCQGDSPPAAQTLVASYWVHSMAVGLVSPYLYASAQAAAAGKPFVMFETNTASCGGFIGLSDSFGAALWLVDYSLQMAWGNFSNALYHFGGQNVAYNPFTPPPGTVEQTYQWTTGPLYYGMLAVAEALGPANNSRVVDLGLNFNNEQTPGYAIYQNGAPNKMMFINYMDGTLGAADYRVNITFNGGAVPPSVNLRRLSAASTAQKFNITWAGQGMGGIMESDGRLQGAVVTENVPCDANGCPITVHAPSAVLVFLTADALNADQPAATATFATTTNTDRYAGGATVDQAVLATSNGRGGSNGTIDGGSTSAGKEENAAGLSRSVSLLAILVSVGLGAVVILGRVR